MKCLSNGTWSKEVPTCEPRFCDVAKCAEHQFCLEIDGLAKCRFQEIRLETSLIISYFLIISYLK